MNYYNYDTIYGQVKKVNDANEKLHINKAIYEARMPVLKVNLYVQMILTRQAFCIHESNTGYKIIEMPFGSNTINCNSKMRKITTSISKIVFGEYEKTN